MSRGFSIDIQFDGELYVATSKELPEVATYAEDRPTALDQARDAVDAAVRHRLRKGISVPHPIEMSGLVSTVTLDPILMAKLALNQAWRQTGWTKSEFAARLGVTEAIARRLLDPDHENRLSALAGAADVLGFRLVIDLEPAQ
jgi:antitoxin HicB